MFYFNCSISCFTNNNIPYFNNEFFCCRDGSKQSEKETKAYEKKGLDKLSSWIG